MRLIDADALKANMKKAEEQANTFEMLVEFYEQIIDNAPTVNPVCWNCEHFGENAVTGHCIKCRDKDMWELKKGGKE